ncbi:MAG TPA: universal stress protein [Flavobacteriales bacterium]
MKKIIVPSDFSEVADSAIKYALNINKVFNYDIVLLHIAKSNDDVAEAGEKLKAQAAKFSANLTTHVSVGDIFDDIPKAAAELGAELIVMGTHGLRGLMQFIVGGNAMRIITNSDVPVIVTQSDNQKTGISKVLLSLDLNEETKQGLPMAREIAQRFNAEIHIVSPDESDEFLRNKILRNLQFAENYLSQHGLSYKAQFIEAGSAYHKEVVKYAKYNDIDLICILNNADEKIIHAFGIDIEQKLITNDADIPVMVMNETQTYINDGTIFTH